MKKWIIRIAIAGVILVIVGLVLAFVFLNSIVKKGVETVGPALTQVEVRLGSAKISPFSGSGELEGLFVGNPEGYKTPSAIQVGNVKVKVDISSVKSDIIVIESVNIQAPDITIEGGLKANNLTKILDNLNAATGGSSPAPKEEKKEAPPAEGGKKLKVKDLVIAGGKVRANLNLTGGKEITVSLPDIHLTDIGADENGVSPAELSRIIVKEILEGATKSVGNVAGAVTEVGKEAGEKVKGTAEKVKGLFRR